MFTDVVEEESAGEEYVEPAGVVAALRESRDVVVVVAVVVIILSYDGCGCGALVFIQRFL